MKQTILFLLAALLLAGLALPAVAISPSYEPSAVYRRSTYYQNLKNLPQTGNGAFDTLSVALSQYTYHEGASTSDFDGENTSSSGNYTEYNFALGKVGGSYSYAWCAAFVSWCLSQAGEADSAGGAFASCTLWVERLQALGRYSKRSSGYAPKSGDLIFFRSSGTARTSDHVGLVRYVNGGRVYTVEGNSSGQVALRNYPLGDTYIVGYGSPAYQGRAKEISRLAAEDSATGWYIVTYDFLNVRTSRSASAQKAGALDAGDMIRVLEIKDGWGSIAYNGKTAYVSLEYADFVAPVIYEIRYASEGKTLLSRELYSTDALTVAAFTPEREGYRFLHWSDGAGKSYLPADKLSPGDVTLEAVWEVLPPPVIDPPDEPEEESGDSPEITPDTGDVPTLEEEILPELPLAPPESGELVPEILPSSPDMAARHAGVVSALLALCLAGAWLALRKE